MGTMNAGSLLLWIGITALLGRMLWDVYHLNVERAIGSAIIATLVGTCLAVG
jgi:hypothetical protein